MARTTPALATLPRRAALCAALMLAGLTACQRAPGADGFIAEARQYRQNGQLKAAVIQLKNALQARPNDTAARQLLGEVYIEAGDPLSAEKELRRALALGATPVQIMPALGKAMLMMGQNEKVLAEIRLDAGAPEQPEVVALRANAYLAGGDVEQARLLFGLLLRQHAERPDALLGLARIAQAAGELDKAAALVGRALAKQAADLDALRLNGDLLRLQGKTEAALAAYRHILSLRPDNTFAHVDIANLHIQSGKFVEAKQEIEAARKSAPGSLIVLHAQTLLDFREGKNQAALEGLQQVLRAAPEHMPSVLLMGAVQMALGSAQQAEQHLRRFLEANPNHLYASKLLATIAVRTGKQDRAVDILEPLLPVHGSDTELLALLGEAHMRARRFAQAAVYFEKASALAPDAPALRTALGVSRLGLGENGRAIAELERAAALDGKQSQAGVMLVMTLLRDKEYDKALAAAEAMVQQQGANPLVHNLKGGVYLAKRDLAAARVAFEQALRADPAYLPAMENLAQLDLADNKPDAARLRFEAALAKDPGSPALMAALSKLALARQQPAEALRWLERSHKDNPDALQPAMQLSNLYLRNGDTKKALTLVRALQTGHPDNPDILALRAQVEYSGGDQAAALDSYARLARLQPGSAELQLRVATLQMALNDQPAALLSVRRALSLQPGMLEAEVTEAALLLDKGSHAEALQLARGVQQRRPTLAAGFKLEGDVLMAQQQPQAALKLYERAYGMDKIGPLLVQIHRALLLADKPEQAQARIDTWLRDNPADLSTRLYLAGARLARKDYKGAIVQYEKMLRLDPKNIVALNDLAWAYQQDKDKRALATAELAYQQQASNPAVLDTLGWILIEQGSAARALPLLQKASALAPKAPDIGYHLGVALMKSGDKKAARSQLEQILAANKDFPGRADAQALLAQL
ncbi:MULTISPECIES: XrtA/PEP-CTERM system TPR-repeat protein PrsT [unclassified Janthinobacterium]|uniref:XrtA/PEP-CTERM system TPR-repeat protein PrsT n=1 Tax=unclassified Janthinobacterium TaxID=2610881 RepID=UPI00034C16E5|nr:MULTISPECIES: XrtA/PEP-CTERM system TPR-repeat protein PrsT [unclassified Janthinobacterium]MEC5161319.1 putative PEP-CTERM system TPR-repeat lipoprotein [Janthinobacterium sp. CG_S6]